MNSTSRVMLAGGVIVVIGLAMKFTGDSSVESKIYLPPKGASNPQAAFLKSPDLSWAKIAEYYAPSQNVFDWQKLQPEGNWRAGKSAEKLASSWENANPDLPREVAALFGGPAELLIATPEHKTPLPPKGGTPSQTDILAFVRTNGEVCTLAVEGKMDESFGPTVGKWLEGASPGKIERLKYISEKLGLSYPPAGEIRYQLLHRTASAVIEAERFNTDCAAVIIHSFSEKPNSFKDFGTFLNLFGIHSVGEGKLYRSNKPKVPLHFGWAFSPPGGALSGDTIAGKFQFDASLAVILAGVLTLAIGFGLGFRGRNSGAVRETARDTRVVQEEASGINDLAHSFQEIQEKLDKLIKETEKSEKSSQENENEINGYKFEQYVVLKFNIKGGRFSLRDWAGDKYVDGIYAETTKGPDLKLSLHAFGKEWMFSVECKWKNSFENVQTYGVTKHAKQLENYQNYERHTKEKTFIVLGVGGTADNPEDIFIIPVVKITETKLTKDQLNPYLQRNRGNFYYDTKNKTLTLLRSRD